MTKKSKAQAVRTLPKSKTVKVGRVDQPTRDNASRRVVLSEGPKDARSSRMYPRGSYSVEEDDPTGLSDVDFESDISVEDDIYEDAARPLFNAIERRKKKRRLEAGVESDAEANAGDRRKPIVHVYDPKVEHVLEILSSSESEGGDESGELSNGRIGRRDVRKDIASSSKEAQFMSLIKDVYDETCSPDDIVPVARYILLDEDENENLTDARVVERAIGVLKERVKIKGQRLEKEGSGQENALPPLVGEADDVEETVDHESETDDEDVKNAKRKRRKSSRYFTEADISTKCHRCGQVGHMAFECTNKRALRPCFMCGKLGHEARDCTEKVCYRCGQTGHIADDCTSKVRIRRRGPSGIIEVCMDLRRSMNGGMRDIRCMVCGGFGHIICGLRSSNVQHATVSCSNCGEEGHTQESCRRPREREIRGNDGAGQSNTSTRSSMVCFLCGKEGHKKSDCPSRRPRRHSMPPLRSSRYARGSSPPPKSHWRSRRSSLSPSYAHGYSSFREPSPPVLPRDHQRRRSRSSGRGRSRGRGNGRSRR